MDNKEAINWMTRIRDRLMTTSSKQFEALTFAIAALEQQEKAFDEWCTDCKEYDKDRHCCQRFSRVIRQAVEDHRREWPVYGKWIRSGTEGHIICNKCGYEAKYTIVERQDAIGKWISRFAQDMKPNFCPNCGAKMNGGDEHE